MIRQWCVHNLFQLFKVAKKICYFTFKDKKGRYESFSVFLVRSIQLTYKLLWVLVPTFRRMMLSIFYIECAGCLEKVVVVFLPGVTCKCWYLFLLQCSDRPQACMQITLSGAERQFCVSDLSGLTAGERSGSAAGQQSGFVNFLRTASQLLSPQTLTSHEGD